MNRSLAPTCPIGSCIVGTIAGYRVPARTWAEESLRFEGKLELWNALKDKHDLPSIGGIERYETCPACCSPTSATGKKPGAEDFQARVHVWILACFNEQIAKDTGERNERFLEEALEMVQANGLPVEAARELVEYVYNRAVGEPEQEAGGVMVTFAALCQSAGLDLVAAGEKELTRISDPMVMEKIRLKQLSKPAMSALPGVYPDRVLASSTKN